MAKSQVRSARPMDEKDRGQGQRPEERMDKKTEAVDLRLTSQMDWSSSLLKNNQPEAPEVKVSMVALHRSRES